MGAGAAQQNAQVVTPGAAGLSYTATVKFAVPPLVPGQLESELRATLDRSSGLSNPAAVQLITGANGAVVLRGRVRDADEARLAAGLLATTPGVRTVTNELTFPKE
jgi:osmotically-inducible protein OsmY